MSNSKTELSYEQKAKKLAEADAYFQERFKEYKRFVELSDRISEEAKRTAILTAFRRKNFPARIRERPQLRDFKIQGLGVF